MRTSKVCFASNGFFGSINVLVKRPTSEGHDERLTANADGH